MTLRINMLQYMQ